MGRGYAEGAWSGTPNVRLHVRGLAMAVMRRWDTDAGIFRGWYVKVQISHCLGGDGERVQRRLTREPARRLHFG